MKNLMVLIFTINIKILWAATHVVDVYDNRFEPEVVVIQSGDTIQWQVLAGNHTISSLPNSQDINFTTPGLTQNSLHTISLTGSGGEIQYTSTADEGMIGAILIESEANDFVIDEKINAAYHNPANPGQGFLFEYVPSTQLMIAYWFTYNKQGDGQQWLVATGVPSGNRVTLSVVEPKGGQLNDSQPVVNAPWGEATIEFSDCLQATAYYNADGEKHSGEFPLERIYLTQKCL